MRADRAADLQRRQQVLLARSTALRERAGVQLAAWRPALAWADRVRDGWRWLHDHPEWPLGAAVVLVVLRPRRALRWGLRLWSGWRLLRRLQRALQPPA